MRFSVPLWKRFEADQHHQASGSGRTPLRHILYSSSRFYSGCRSVPLIYAVEECEAGFLARSVCYAFSFSFHRWPDRNPCMESIRTSWLFRLATTEVPQSRFPAPRPTPSSPALPFHTRYDTRIPMSKSWPLSKILMKHGMFKFFANISRRRWTPI